MAEGINHIISKFRWESSFDRKDNAAQLQERLSSWSHNIMPREIAGIFDEICLAGQTWKIESLELDLGEINFNDLETELSVRIRQQLRATLVELIINANRNGDNIEILNEDVSHVNVLKAFLLTGVLPWNHK